MSSGVCVCARARDIYRYEEQRVDGLTILPFWYLDGPHKESVPPPKKK